MISMSCRMIFIVIVGVVADAPSVFAQEPEGEAAEIARTVLTAGAEMFQAKDAEGLAATYRIDATLELIKRDESTGGLTSEKRIGRSDILAFYRSLFRGDDPIEAVNRVEYARLLGGDVLLIAGTFELTAGRNTTDIPFVQTRVKTGEDWMVREMRIYTLGK